jgi:hypothetical protein
MSPRRPGTPRKVLGPEIVSFQFQGRLDHNNFWVAGPSATWQAAAAAGPKKPRPLADLRDGSNEVPPNRTVKDRSRPTRGARSLEPRSYSVDCTADVAKFPRAKSRRCAAIGKAEQYWRRPVNRVRLQERFQDARENPCHACVPLLARVRNHQTRRTRSTNSERPLGRTRASIGRVDPRSPQHCPPKALLARMPREWVPDRRGRPGSVSNFPVSVFARP